MTGISFALVILLAVSFFFAKMGFLSTLKRDAPEDWIAIGRPSPIANNFSFIFFSRLEGSKAVNDKMRRWLLLLKALFLFEMAALLVFGVSLLI